MSQQSEKSKAIKRLQALRNIGPKMAEKLYALGVKTPKQMIKEDPEELFERLKIIDNNVDPCELYVFRGAILDLPWWECKNLTKRKKVKTKEGEKNDEQGRNTGVSQ